MRNIEVITESLDLLAGFELYNDKEQTLQLLYIAEIISKPHQPKTVKEIGAYFLIQKAYSTCLATLLKVYNNANGGVMIKNDLETALSLIVD